jgi:hypothetical protein
MKALNTVPLAGSTFSLMRPNVTLYYCGRKLIVLVYSCQYGTEWNGAALIKHSLY